MSGSLRPRARTETTWIADVARRVLREQSEQRVSLAAAGAAFWLVIAAFPTVIAMVSIYGLSLGLVLSVVGSQQRTRR